jgi:hypothetical protein
MSALGRQQTFLYYLGATQQKAAQRRLKGSAYGQKRSLLNVRKSAVLLRSPLLRLLCAITKGGQL